MLGGLVFLPAVKQKADNDSENYPHDMISG